MSATMAANTMTLLSAIAADIRAGFFGDWLVTWQHDGMLELEHLVTQEQRTVKDPTWKKSDLGSGLALSKLREFGSAPDGPGIAPLPPPPSGKLLRTKNIQAQLNAELEAHKRWLEEYKKIKPPTILPPPHFGYNPGAAYSQRLEDMWNNRYKWPNRPKKGKKDEGPK